MGKYNISPDLNPFEDVILYEDEDHKVIYLGTYAASREWNKIHKKGTKKKVNGEVDVLSYLIINKNEGFIVDPGGYNIFPRLITNISKYLDMDKIKYIYMCHQDPDVCASITMWRDVAPKAKILIGQLWVRFIPHFGVLNFEEVCVPIPPQGMEVELGSSKLQILPAHYMHSPNHFSIYDPISKFLFTGDIGIAVLPDPPYLVVSDWPSHMQLMKPVHEILMASNKICRHWVERMRKLEIEAILPQHGAIIPKEHIEKFFRFLENLKCGIDLI